MKLHKFSAEIFIIGVNPYVFLPEDILQGIFEQAGKERGAIPVMGTLNDKPFKQTLVKYAGAWRLYLNGPMRQAAGIAVGDMAYVEIAYDPIPRIEPMNHELEKAFKNSKNVAAIFAKLPPSHKKEINRYLNSMKTEESMRRNVQKVLLHLMGKKTDTLYALMRRKP